MTLARGLSAAHICNEDLEMTGESPTNARPRTAEHSRRPLVPSLNPAVVTTRGRRDTNQDRVCALRTLVGGEPAVLLAVADGIGGLPAGEQAAELALQAVGHYAHYVLPVSKPTAAGLRAAMSDLVHAAGRRIWRWARDQGLGGAAGSTLVCALVWDHHYLVAHAGDSRCYYVNHRMAGSLTLDHTEAARLARQGGLGPEEARRSPLSHRLTNALGWPTNLVVDLVPGSEELGALDEDCALLVCSDGLYTMMTEAEFHAALHETASVEEACRRLVALAIERGATDNVSVAAVEVGRLARSA
jgi:serine/threonine protein phosphatase PrpC